LLTIGILSEQFKPNLGFLLSWEPKETWALITCFVFAICILEFLKVGPVNAQRLLLLSVLLLFGSVI
jgi:ABC-type transport system involved in cytochrome c biogenesis permease subunit